MHLIEKQDIQYITDAAGKKSAVILPLDQFYELMENLEDLAVIVERRNESTISHQQVLEELSSTP